MSVNLTDEQRARIARNLDEAKKRRAQRELREKQQAAAAAPPAPAPARPAAAPVPAPGPARSAAAAHTKIAPIFQRNPSRLDPTCVIRTKDGPISSNKQGANREPPVQRISQITVSFTAMNENRFKVIFLPFHMDIVGALKKVPSRTFCDKVKCWAMNLTDYNMTKRILNELTSVRVTIIDIPDVVLKALEMVKKNKTSVAENVLVSAVGPTLYDQLFPYQREGLRFGVEKNGRVMIADEMGLGKSIQALAIAKYYQNEWPLLIVCPSSVKFAWKNQIQQFLPSISPDDVLIIEKGKDPLPACRTTNTVIVMSYDVLSLKLKAVTDYKFYVLIFDECHVLKDAKTKRANSANDLGRIARRTILLSGTPALSRPAELFSQIRIINPRLFPNFRNFAERYCDGKEGKFGYEAKGATNTDELAAVLFSCVMIRRLKKNLLHELPSKIREVVHLSGDALKKELEKIQRAKDAFEAVMDGDKAETQRSMMEFYAQTGCAKAKAVSNHIIEQYFGEDAPRRKVIVFAHHQMVLDTLCFCIQKKGLKYIRIDGSTKNRGEQCRLFQEDDDYVVAVLGITAAGTGITLTAATVVIFAELHWNPGTLMQCEDRAHRVGQKDSVNVQYLLASGTADDFIWPLVQRKMAVLGSVNLSSDNFRGAASSSIHVPSGSDITRYFPPVAEEISEENEEPAAKRART